MEENSMRARSCLNFVGRELDELHVQKRDDKETIKLLQEEVRILREEKEDIARDADDEMAFLNDRLEHTNKNYSYTIMQMCVACIVAFIAIGALAWNF